MHFRTLLASVLLGLTMIMNPPVLEPAFVDARAEAVSICHALESASPVADITSSRTTDGSTPFDLRIIDEMIGHHASALAMANIALQQSQNSQVRRIALRVTESQAGEIQLLRHWRNTWFPGADQTSPSPNESNGQASTSMGDSSITAMLCTAGSDFDRVFLSMMIAHHQRAIEIAEAAIAKADHADLIAFAATVVEVQGDEIAMMIRLRNEMDASTPVSG